MNGCVAHLVIAAFLLSMVGCRATLSERQPAPLTAEEQRLVGTWRFSRTVHSDDNQEGTQLMVLNPDRTWLQASYPGKDEIPTQFWKIIRGPHWMCTEGHLQQNFPPPKGGGTHRYSQKISSLTPTSLAFEYMRKPWLGPMVYTRVSGQPEVEIKKLLEKIKKEAILPNVKARCEQAMLAICRDIVTLKPKFPELANFDAGNNVVPGNVIPETKQLQGLRLDYYHNFKHIKGPDKTQSYFKANPGGCILNVQLFPDGGSWKGFRLGVRTIHIRCKSTGVCVQASIDCSNDELTNRLEEIIRKEAERLK